MTFASISWADWTPTVRATLLFVWRDDALLLIRKKRGLGAGKINAVSYTHLTLPTTYTV